MRDVLLLHSTVIELILVELIHTYEYLKYISLITQLTGVNCSIRLADTS